MKLNDTCYWLASRGVETMENTVTSSWETMEKENIQFRINYIICGRDRNSNNNELRESIVNGLPRRHSH